MRLLDMANCTAMCAASMVIGALFMALMIVSGDTKIITNNFTCTKTAIVGETPNRKETCVEYTYKEQP